MNDTADKPNHPAGTGGPPATILILDDDPSVRAATSAALQRYGYRLLEAADVGAAMALLEQEGGAIDLLLADVALPGSEGGPALAARAREMYPDLKLVFMSGYAAELYTGDKVPGFEDPLVSKPFELTDLVKTVQDTLARQGGRGPNIAN